PLSSNLTHHCGAGDTTAKLPDILNGILRPFALQRRASLQLLRYLFFHTPVAREFRVASAMTTSRSLELVASDSSLFETTLVSLGSALIKRRRMSAKVP